MSQPLVITPGDPLGVGPEVVARCLAERVRSDTLPLVTVVGARDAFARSAKAADLAFEEVDDLVARPNRVSLYVPSSAHEPVEIAAIRQGAQACLDGRASALVTGPIHKAKLSRLGFMHTGHTTFLGELCGVDRPVMAFVGGPVCVALVTVHLPLSAVPTAITGAKIEHTVRVASEALSQQRGIAAPRIGLCGLNPHAGDDGLLGREEIECIAPAAERLRASGYDIRGPMSSETAFVQAVDGVLDLVVAMYHDQGLTPLKALAFGKTVNWTLGLPMVRTSVDHGTAYDLVGTGRARHDSLEAALSLAEELVSGQD